MPEKRKELIEIDKEVLRKEAELFREKYEINFEARNQKIQTNNNQQNNMYIAEIKKEKWYKRAINKILKFFKINNKKTSI